jgi:type IV secretory pathway VirD2 relaxase
MIARGRYVKGGTANRASAASQLGAQLKYLEHRSRDEQESREDRSIFSKREDHVDRRDAVEDVMEHTSHRVSYHKIVLSPGDDEPIQDWREWTREVMADLEDEQGKEMHWYAVHHSNTEHEHVHVVIAGAGEDRETGQEQAVTLYQEDYQRLREAGHEHSDHDFYYRLEDLLKELDRQDDLERVDGVRTQEFDPRSESFQAVDLDQGDYDR